MKVFWIAFVLALLLSITGCTLAMLNQLDKGQAFTPEQIKAYKEQNMDVYGCFTIGGPPPAGMTTWIIVPKDSRIAVKFGDGCHLLSQ